MAKLDVNVAAIRTFKRKCTRVKNAGFDIESMTTADIDSAYSELQSKSTRNAYSKWKMSMSQRDDSFAERARKGLMKRGHLLAGVEASNMSECELYELACESLGGPEKSSAIRSGLRRCHGEAINDIFAARARLVAAKRLQITLDELTPELHTQYLRDIGFYNKDPTRRKHAHLVNEGVTCDNLSDNEVNRLYSEYMSRRWNASMLNSSVGWKHTKKGEFIFNSGVRYYYRSSWEEKLFLAVNQMLITDDITVLMPKKIPYIDVVGITRHYYPDMLLSIGSILLNIEVKPKLHVDKPINVLKFEAARREMSGRFFVFTEDELDNPQQFVKRCIDAIR